jgi:hypothetical protein
MNILTGHSCGGSSGEAKAKSLYHVPVFPIITPLQNDLFPDAAYKSAYVLWQGLIALPISAKGLPTGKPYQARTS